MLLRITRMMRILLLLIIPTALLVSSGCTPLAAIGAVGTTVTNAAYNEAERRNRPSYTSYSERAQQVSEANLQLGVAYMQNGQLDKALEKLERARQARKDNAQVYNALGLLYRKMQQDAEAEQHFKHALKLEPGNSSILNNYGLLLCQNERYDEAEAVFIESAENPLYRKPELALTNAGTCAMENDKPDKAEKFFLSALNKNATVAPALIQMTEISFMKGDYPAAQHYLNRYIRISPHTPKSLWLGVQIERRLGNRDTASSYALLLRNTFPDTEEAEELSQQGI